VMVMIYKFFLMLIFSTNLLAINYLSSNYYIKSNNIMLSDIVTSSNKKDIKLFTIRTNNHILRVNAKRLLILLSKYGFNNYNSRHPYIQFTKKSPIDTTKIKNQLEKIYRNKYKSIHIKSVKITPRSYMDKLPYFDNIRLQSRSYLSKNGILYIKTKNRREIFFNYMINASLNVALY